MRSDGRQAAQLRPTKLERNVLDYAEGSCLVTVGRTRVLCAASVQKELPRWLTGRSQGWITAEYSMLPRSTQDRSNRERLGRIGGRTQEIQRLIGRSLRAVTDLNRMPGTMITLDCDVLQADGGTRTASITGAFVALVDAFRWCKKKSLVDSLPLCDFVAAVSVGIVDGRMLMDLDYGEDSAAEVDCNFVMTGKGRIVEVQGTAESMPFTEEQFLKMMKLAGKGIKNLIDHQKKAIGARLALLEDLR